MSSKEFDSLVQSVSKRFDKVLDVYTDMDFTEITGKIGGDTVTYRVRKNGTVTER